MQIDGRKDSSGVGPIRTRPTEEAEEANQDQNQLNHLTPLNAKQNQSSHKRKIAAAVLLPLLGESQHVCWRSFPWSSPRKQVMLLVFPDSKCMVTSRMIPICLLSTAMRMSMRT
ncbi:hypothetical protein VKT23_009451 [Stygiomarasmius scandens]|uniref:Uncharacterized protein n=1 Tax=Marasmiellus scandens TaxID=2682957 RepID=A0ABR1JEM2_9AGAR